MKIKMKIISTENLRDHIINKDNVIIIDVRELFELQYGIIPTSIHIPLSKIEFFLSNPSIFKKNYNKDLTKSKHIIFYCRTGNRSAQATQIAIRLGFKNTQNYKGSIWEWSEIDPNVKRYGAFSN